MFVCKDDCKYNSLGLYEHAPGLRCLLCFLDLLPLNYKPSGPFCRDSAWVGLICYNYGRMLSPSIHPAQLLPFPKKGHFHQVEFVYKACNIETSGAGGETGTKLWHK